MSTATKPKAPPPYTSPFAPLHLGARDAQMLRDVTRSLVADSVRDFDKFMTQFGLTQSLPRASWKLLHQEEDFRIYLERRDAHTPAAQGARGNALATIVGSGIVHGSLADCLYGVITTTIDQARVKGAYNKDTLSNMALLATIDEPTVDDPFRSLSVRWYVKKLPAIVHALLKHEDSTIIEATGVTTGTSAALRGQQLGYHLVHTIELPTLGELKEYRRVELSAVTLWKPRDAESVYVYLKTFADVKTVLAPPALTAIAQVFSVTVHYPHVAHMKKLSWMLRCKAMRARYVKDELVAALILDCIACHKSLERVLGPRKHRCVLCRLPVCSKCAVKQAVYAISTERDEVKPYRVRLCPGCWDLVVTTDTEEIAHDEMVGACGRSNGELLSLTNDEESSAKSDTDSRADSRADSRTDSRS